ncbi:MAG: hypothetical protein FWC51_00095 [Proteobacteria bacterium]|nr:hypothetical protein [Pseudomonadota bacterium]
MLTAPFNLTFYDYAFGNFQKVMQFQIKRPRSLERTYLEITAALDKDNVFTQKSRHGIPDYLAIRFFEQLNISEKERLYKIIKPLIEQYNVGH